MSPGIARDERYLPIGDYAFLSDCISSALVSRHGSIDWACLRRFDAGSAFSQLLDADRGGSFSIRPVEEITDATRHYAGASLVLATTMWTASGAIRVTDAFAMEEGGAGRTGSELVRLIECIEGSVEVELLIAPRFDYGEARPWFQLRDDGRCTAIGGDDALVIHTAAEVGIEQDGSLLRGRQTLSVGDEITISMVATPAHLVDTGLADSARVRERLDVTTRWWERWSERTDLDDDLDDDLAELLRQSAVVLKGLTCAPTGAIVAAATTSLPEVVGGAANWDYRYSWVRDSTMVLDALSEVGHHEVAQGFRDFVMRSSAGRGDELQIMYGPYGERRLTEIELDLEGWRGSTPVRVGNAAAGQRQLDVYGHLLDASLLWHTRVGDLAEDEWEFLSSVVDEALAHRDEPDSGIWEQRGPMRHHVHSKVMIWVALDRGIRLVDEHGFADGSSDRWRTARDQIRREVESRGVHPDHGHFVQHYGSTEVDASLLKLPLVGFIDACDERMLRTTQVIREQLGVGPHGLLRRRPDTDRSAATAGEGVFLLCSFWLVEVLVLQGCRAEAEQLFRDLLDVGNDLDLYAEEYDPDSGELLGNFPQAFTHLGIISAAACLRRDRSGER